MTVDGKRMRTFRAMLGIPVLLAVVVAAYGCAQDATPIEPPSASEKTATATALPPPTPTAIPPSTTPRDVSQFGLFSGSGGAAYGSDYVSHSVEDVLEKGLYAAGASPTHIALRGTAEASGVRCAGEALPEPWRRGSRRYGSGLAWTIVNLYHLPKR